jgi:hypothetical protein
MHGAGDPGFRSAPGFYPGRGAGVAPEAAVFDNYVSKHKARIAELAADVAALRSGRTRGGCIGETVDICVASLAQGLVVTTDPIASHDDLLDPPEVDVNGKTTLRASTSSPRPS